MTNEIIKPEAAVDLFGLQARAFAVVANTETGRILNQKIGHSKYYREAGEDYRISVDLRFDDQCGNGHETFSITGSVYEHVRGRYRDYMAGCIHEEIAKHFPELVHLIKWHLVSADGPMHYLGNACYLAGDRDYNGRAAGEPSTFDRFLRFGKFPISYPIKTTRFDKFLQSVTAGGIGQIIEVQHKEDGKPGGYQFGPKFTVDGFPCQWHECPFDSRQEAEEFRKAFNNSKLEFLSIATAWSTGKARELDAARRVAVWPDATDEELSRPRAELEALVDCPFAGIARGIQGRHARGRFSLARESTGSGVINMPITFGTSHFVGLLAARVYYRSQGYGEDTNRAVDEKIKAGEIHIGRPATLPGDVASVIPGEGRYQITRAVDPASLIDEAEQIRRGELLAETLQLKKKAGRYLTTWGDKTALGLFLTVKRIVNEGA